MSSGFQEASLYTHHTLYSVSFTLFLFHFSIHLLVCFGVTTKGTILYRRYYTDAQGSFLDRIDCLFSGKGSSFRCELWHWESTGSGQTQIKIDFFSVWGGNTCFTQLLGLWRVQEFLKTLKNKRILTRKIQISHSNCTEPSQILMSSTQRQLSHEIWVNKRIQYSVNTPVLE